MNRNRGNFLKLATKPNPMNSATLMQDLYNDKLDEDSRKLLKKRIFLKRKISKSIRLILKKKKIKIVFEEEDKLEKILTTVNESGNLHYFLSRAIKRSNYIIEVDYGGRYDNTLNDIIPSKNVELYEINRLEPVRFSKRYDNTFDLDTFDYSLASVNNNRGRLAYTNMLANYEVNRGATVASTRKLSLPERVKLYTKSPNTLYFGYLDSMRRMYTRNKSMPEYVRNLFNFEPVDFDRKYNIGDEDTKNSLQAKLLNVKYENPITLNGQNVYQRVTFIAPRTTTVYALMHALPTSLKVKTKYDKKFNSIFLETIDGKKDGNHGNWEFYVNGEIGKNSVDKQIVNEGDVVEWRFAKEDEGGCGGGTNGTPSYLPSKVSKNEKYSLTLLSPNSFYTFLAFNDRYSRNNHYSNLRFS